MDLIIGCQWWQVYDLCEALVDYLVHLDAGQCLTLSQQRAVAFQERLDNVMDELGLGWQMKHGRVEAREEAPIEALLQESDAALAPQS